MTRFPSSDRDREQLSAYLDGNLSASDRAAFETRLTANPALQSALDDLRNIKTRLGALPVVKAPRNFTITPAMIGQSARRASTWLPALNFATAIAAVLFVAVVAGNVLGRSGTVSTAAPAPAAEVSLAEAPVNADTAAATAEPPVALQAPVVPAATESAAEPSTGTAGVGAGGGGEGDAPAAAPATSAAQKQTATETGVPTPEGLLRVADTPTPETLPTATAAAPVPEAPTAEPAPAAVAPAVNIWQIAQLALGLILIGLITASVIVRRR
ncbi:MAG: hypothetical protein HY679_01280 [Chloroflexi bacterium]|nr:hypothetical protein [Chloroflexota bacterium]